jgi:hypothetical protein
MKITLENPIDLICGKDSYDGSDDDDWSDATCDMVSDGQKSESHEGKNQQTFLLCEVCETFGKSPQMLVFQRCKGAYHIPCAKFDEKAARSGKGWGSWYCTTCLKGKQTAKLPSLY